MDMQSNTAPELRVQERSKNLSVNPQITEGRKADMDSIALSNSETLASQHENDGSTVETLHYKEWSIGSGIDTELIQLNLKSLNDRDKIKQHLKWFKYGKDLPLGWIFHSVKIDRRSNTREKSQQICFKPNEAIQFDEGEKPVKYFGAKGSKGILIPELPDANYWSEFLRSSRPLVITEGIKKALAVISSLKLAAVGLTGVTVWGEKAGKEYSLLPDLEKLAKGREVIILFDRDQHFNFNVKQQIKKLGETLGEVASSVFVAAIPETSEHKGIDDLYVAEGLESVQSVISTRTELTDWVIAQERFLHPSPSDAVISEVIRKLYFGKLAYRPAMDEFYAYQEVLGYWQILGQPDERTGKVESIESQVQRCMREELGIWKFGENRIKSIVSLLKRDLLVRWQIHPHVRNFQNGQYDTKSQTFRDQWDKRLYVTDEPSYRYDPKAECPHWKQYLDFTFDGNASTIKAFQCLFRWCLSPNPALHKFGHFEGFPGTGKSTGLTVLQKLVGIANTFSTSLNDLENNRFILYALINKTLVVIPDAEKWEGKPTKLKTLTGRDRINLEAKFRQPSSDAVFEGAVVIASNGSIKFSYDGGALMRRRMRFLFEKVVEIVDAQLPEKLDRELPGIFNWVMEATEEDVENYLNKTAIYAPQVHRWNIEAQTDTDSVAEWASENLVIRPDESTPVGKIERDDLGNLLNTDCKLYPAYLAFCEGCGYKNPVTLNDFSSRLETFLVGNLKIKGVKFIKPKNVKTFKGITLRSSYDEDQTLEKLHEQPKQDAEIEAAKLFEIANIRDEISLASGNDVALRKIFNQSLADKDEGFLKELMSEGVSDADKRTMRIIYRQLTKTH